MGTIQLAENGGKNSTGIENVQIPRQALLMAIAKGSAVGCAG
ncbi:MULTISPECIES: hypothetical protein [unclassified Synechocystis]|nr:MULTISPECIES: hypothetical protein [unclassified Synechocystis]AIE75621.1 hypothetical protein D082_30930 [Synechocystis sp. PCC 6714]